MPQLDMIIKYSVLDLRKNTTIKCTLRKRKAQQVILDETVCVGKVSEQLINEYNAALILQNIIRGRATQSLVRRFFRLFIHFLRVCKRLKFSCS